MEGKNRPELRSVTKIHETRDIDEAAAMLNQGGWVIIAIAKGEDGYLFSLGYMEISSVGKGGPYAKGKRGLPGKY